MAADLLGAPAPTQQFSDHPAEVLVGVDPASVMTRTPCGGAPMRRERTVLGVTGSVAAQLPRDRGGRSTETVGDRAHAQPATTEIGDLDALILRQVPRADLADLQRIQRRDETDHDAVAVGLVTAGPIRRRRPRHTDFPGRGTDAPAPSPQLHEPLTLGRLRTTPRPLLHPMRRCQHNLQNLGKCCYNDWKPPGRKVSTLRLESDHCGGLG